MHILDSRVMRLEGVPCGTNVHQSHAICFRNVMVILGPIDRATVAWIVHTFAGRGSRWEPSFPALKRRRGQLVNSKDGNLSRSTRNGIRSGAVLLALGLAAMLMLPATALGQGSGTTTPAPSGSATAATTATTAPG